MSRAVPAEAPPAALAKMGVALATVAAAREAALHVHWNARGPNYLDAHDLASEAVEALDEAADRIAERVSQLGGVAVVGTAASELDGFPLEERVPMALMGHLAQALRTASEVVREARAEIFTGDPASAVLLDHVSLDLEKAAWKLDSGSGADVPSAQ